MTTGNPKFVRRQKEISRMQEQQKKREERASRRARQGNEQIDDGIAAIQAALDAGLNPGSPEARQAEIADGEGDSEEEQQP